MLEAKASGARSGGRNTGWGRGWAERALRYHIACSPPPIRQNLDRRSSAPTLSARPSPCLQGGPPQCSWPSGLPTDSRLRLRGPPAKHRRGREAARGTGKQGGGQGRQARICRPNHSRSEQPGRVTTQASSPSGRRLPCHQACPGRVGSVPRSPRPCQSDRDADPH